MMAITLDEWAKRLEEASAQGFPAELRKIMIKGALTAEAESKLRASNQGGPASRTGRLSASIRGYVVGKGRESAIVNQADTPYAATQEYGATIRPVRRKWLTIPTAAQKTAAGVSRASAPNTPGLFFAIGKASGKPFLGRRNDDGTVTAMFLLRKSVKVPPSPYLRPGIAKARKTLPPAIHESLDRLIGVPNG